MFTTYKYRVSAYNDYGHTTSESSIEVTTFGGIPTVQPVLSAVALSHTTIGISWVTPGIK